MTVLPSYNLKFNRVCLTFVILMFEFENPLRERTFLIKLGFALPPDPVVVNSTLLYLFLHTAFLHETGWRMILYSYRHVIA